MPVSAQSTQAHVPSPLSVNVMPLFQLPLGDSTRWFTVGGGADLEMRYRFPQSILFVLGGLEYAFTPIPANTSASLAAVRGGGGIQVPLSGTISLFGYAAGGYYAAAYNDFSKSGANPYLAGGMGVSLTLAPGLRLEAGAHYGNYLGLYQGLSAGIGISIGVGNLGGTLEIPTVDLRPAFAVFYKRYDDHPLGSLQLTSSLRVPATDIRAQVYIREYMDAPKSVTVPGTLEPGTSRSIDIYALFNDTVLSVTEGTKVAAEVTVSCKVEGQSYACTHVETLTLWGRNAMTWDDNRKAAAYVTSKDPGVLSFARNVTSYVRGRESRSICDNLQAAIALHEAIDLYGINYSPNPKTPYAEVSKETDVIDFLQFPTETFEYKAGDCSDLSILYGAMFHAVGIDAAFITVPGHIFIAMDTSLSPEEAQRNLIPKGRFITYNGHAWIPIEVTSVHDGFCAAWELGAKQWSESTLTGQAGFYPIAEAWMTYQPVGLPGSDATIGVPRLDDVLSAYLAETTKYLDGTLRLQVAELQDQITATGSPRAMNSLGVLFAKFGEPEKAEESFKRALEAGPYFPALMNLGHLSFRQGSWKDALAYYKQANEMDPANAHTLLALARANQELQNYTEARAFYTSLSAASPGLAAQFAYLGEARESGTRLAETADERGAALWEEE
jgi:tetratricopeptide (TPR) repeat protein